MKSGRVRHECPTRPPPADYRRRYFSRTGSLVLATEAAERRHDVAVELALVRLHVAALFQRLTGSPYPGRARWIASGPGSPLELAFGESSRMVRSKSSTPRPSFPRIRITMIASFARTLVVLVTLRAGAREPWPPRARIHRSQMASATGHRTQDLLE